MRAGLGTSTRISVGDAVAEAVPRALKRIGGQAPDALLLVATAAWGRAALGELASAVAARSGCPAVVGGSVDGLLAGEGWVAQRPALAVLALTGVEAVAWHADRAAGREERIGHEWAASLPDGARPGDLAVLFADAHALAPAPLLAGLAAALPGLPVVGLGAAEPPGGDAVVFGGDEAAVGGCAALLLRAPRPPALAVTHGCRALGPPHEVTRARGHWVAGLAGRPALEVLGEEAGAEAVRRGALVGLLEPDGAGGPADAPLIRNVVGVDAGRGAFALPEAVAVGTRLQVLAPDRDAAAEEIGRRVRAASADAEGPPACGLYWTCRAAGDQLLEAAARERGLAVALDGAPLLGASSPYQIAPAGVPGAPPRLHTYAGVVALLG